MNRELKIKFKTLEQKHERNVISVYSSATVTNKNDFNNVFFREIILTKILNTSSSFLLFFSYA